MSAGQPIGEVANSPCGGNAHIHFSMRRDGGYIDPTRYLEPRIPEIPAWVQECDDYKLVFKVRNESKFTKETNFKFQFLVTMLHWFLVS